MSTQRLLCLLWTLALCVSVQSVIAKERGILTGSMQHEVPKWFKLSFLDIASDARESAETGRHVLLFLQMEDCPYCAAMLQESFVDSDYVDYIRDNFDCIELDVKGDRLVAMNEEVDLPEKELAELLQVRYTPTIIFLDQQGQPVFRLNGYRSATGFKHALDYVTTRAYEDTDLATFIRDQGLGAAYEFREDGLFSPASSLNKTAGRPVAVLFEDVHCDECDEFHNRLMADAEVRELFAQFLFVRLNADSEKPIVDVQGNSTTPREWAKALGLTYRPGLVLFDHGAEIARVDGMLRTYHFSRVLSYVAERQYLSYPTFRDYARAHQQQLLDAGVDIDLWR